MKNFRNIISNKVVLIIFAFFSCLLLLAQDSSRIKDCKCKNISLYGRVKIVESFADFKVKEVDAFPDLKVKRVSYIPYRCGEWRFVDSHPDFTVKFVNAHEDFRIQYVK